MTDCKQMRREYDAAQKKYNKAARNARIKDGVVTSVKEDIALTTVAFFACFSASLETVLGPIVCWATFCVEMDKLDKQLDDADQDAQDAHDELNDAEKELSDARSRYQEKCQDQHAEGCGSRGGPGYRRPDGKCAGWTDHVSAYA